MSDDLIPIFTRKDEDGNYIPVGAVIKQKTETYKASSFIESVVDEISTETESLASLENPGELTVSLYIALETLHKIGLGDLANSILANPEKTLWGAIICAIGIKAGMVIPEDMKFETTDAEDSSNIRLIPKEGLRKED